MILWFQYCPKSKVAEWVASGNWEDCGPCPGPHAEWSHWMKWIGEGEPPARDSKEGE